MYINQDTSLLLINEGEGKKLSRYFPTENILYIKKIPFPPLIHINSLKLVMWFMFFLIFFKNYSHLCLSLQSAITITVWTSFLWNCFSLKKLVILRSMLHVDNLRKISQQNISAISFSLEWRLAVEDWVEKYFHRRIIWVNTYTWDEVSTS